MREQVTPDHQVSSVAYDTSDKPYRGHSLRASYLKNQSGVDLHDALIEIFKDGAVVKSFFYPAYRIYNIAAHFNELIDERLEYVNE